MNKCTGFEQTLQRFQPLNDKYNIQNAYISLHNGVCW